MSTYNRFVLLQSPVTATTPVATPEAARILERLFALGASREAYEALRQAVISRDAGATPHKDAHALERAVAQKVMAFNKTAIAAVLHVRGVAAVAYRYAGEGDSGSMESLDFYDVENNLLDNDVLDGLTGCSVGDTHGLYRPAHPAPCLELIEQTAFHTVIDFCESCIDFAGHSGYENNEGGSGTVTLSVTAADPATDTPIGCTVTIDHEDYIVTSESNHSTF